jgi:predicted RNA-binding Zn-ribbon protein involved in translation (DUF1610 family)
MLSATQEEIDEVTDYFHRQAPDLEVTFLQKIYSEAVIGHRHDVWDVHTNKDRWWVITNPTNLYSQEQFPNMDLAVTFHMGLCLRIPRTQKQRVAGRRVRPFGEVFKELEATSDAVGQAQNVADYQAIGVRVREALLTFIAASQDAHDWGETKLPKRADFKAWTEIIFNAVFPGDGNKERRHLMKTQLEGAWTFSNWLTHSKSATWHDAEMAVAAAEQALGFATSIVIRHTRDVPDQCPNCGSPRLNPEEGRRSDVPDVVWERPVCADCGWKGAPVPVAEEPIDDEDLEFITREGDDPTDDECIIPEVPLRGLKKPSDR